MSLLDKIILFVFFLWLTGCSSKQQQEERQLHEKELITFSQNYVGKRAYQEIRTGIKDSLAAWTSNNLKAYLAVKLYSHELDTILCFNQNRDKLITALLFHCDVPGCKQDDIWYFYGVRIQGKWYYFNGSTMVLPHQVGMGSRSFSALNQIAFDEIFRGYLQKDKAGKWQINEGFFSAMENKNNPAVSSGYGSCFGCKNFDEYVIYLTKKNWQHRDTTNYNLNQ